MAEERIIFQEADGKWRDTRLGSLMDVLHEFAGRHSMELGPRYDYWMLHWVTDGIDRLIQVSVEEGGRTLLWVVPIAWRDDRAALKRYHMRSAQRQYVLRIPVSEAVLFETLDLARNDVLRIDVADVTDVTDLSPMPGERPSSDDTL